MPIKPREPIRKIGRPATKVDLGVAAATTLGLHGDVKPRETREIKRAEQKAQKEVKVDYLKKGFVDFKSLDLDELTKKEISKSNKAAENMLAKINTSQLSEKDVNAVFKTVEQELDLIFKNTNDPELKMMQASLFGDIKNLPKQIWGVLKKGANNFERHYILATLASLVGLGLYLQIARNVRYKGFKKGLEKHSDIGTNYLKASARNWEKYVLMPALGAGILASGYETYIAGIILGAIASPYVRYHASKGLEWLRRR